MQPDPRGDGRAVSRRRIERPDGAQRERRRSQRHPIELRRPERHGRRRAAHDRADDRVGLDVRAAGRTRRVPLALRPRPAATRSTPPASPTRTTCAACRRRTPTAGCTFTTIFPGCYAGRWPHIHFEVFPSLAAARASRTSRDLADRAAEDGLRRRSTPSPGYESSVRNLSRVSLATRQRVQRRLRARARDGDRQRGRRLDRDAHRRGVGGCP